MRRLTVCVMVALATLLLVTSVTRATTVVPVPDDDLIAGAAAIVTGRVTAIESYLDADRIYTNVTLAVHTVLKGEAVPELTLKQVGGRVGGDETWLDGSPEFRRGEHVLVFLRPNPDGTPRVAHLYQGKFSIVADPLTGEEFVHQETPDTVSVLGGVGRRRGLPGPVIRGLRELRELIGQRVRDAAAHQGVGGVARLRSARAPATAAVEPHDRFTYLGSPSRWFEPDGGQPVRVLLDAAGEPRAPGGGFEQVRAGLRAWSTVEASGFRYEDGGTTSAAGFRRDGVSVVSFGDPLGDIDPPSRCTGTLAIGGYHRTGETRVVNGQSFFRIVEGDIVFNSGWDGCGFYEDFASLAEVATHELGHVLGLGHSADDDATMNAFAHFDGRGAALRPDDMAGVRAIYPAAATPSRLTVQKSGTGTGTVTSEPAGIACGSDCTEGYEAGTVVTLTATPAAGSTFGGWSGACTGTATCVVTMDASRTVTGMFDGTSSPAPPTAGIGVTFPGLTEGQTVTGASVQVTIRASGTSGSVNRFWISVNGLQRDHWVVSSTEIKWWWALSGLLDGEHTLSVNVEDATGKTGTGTIRVRKGATTAPPPSGGLTVTFPSLTEGQTVSGGSIPVVIRASGSSASPNRFWISVDGAPRNYWVASGSEITWWWRLTGLGPGEHTLSVTVEDATGTSGTGSIRVQKL